MSDLTNTSTGTAGGQQLGTQDQAPAQTQAAGEKKDWLDKGITAAGKKLGFNISDKNADKAGDFMNKQFAKKGGHGLPGVQ